MASPRKIRDPHWDVPTVPPHTVDVGQLHGALVNVLRLLRDVDRESGVSPSRLSALSVLVFVGAMSQAELARIEAISAPSMSLLVRELEADGLVERAVDPADARRTIVSASEEGRALMLRCQRRRLEWLGTAISSLPAEAQRALADSGAHLAALIVALRDSHPTDA
jgi:DNA-binding MarR family transcriptional regulator